MHWLHGMTSVRMTRSPTFHVSDPGPTDSMTPAPSCPSTIGRGPSTILPESADTSEWHSPHAWTLRRTSLGPGGEKVSRSTVIDPYFRTTHPRTLR